MQKRSDDELQFADDDQLNALSSRQDCSGLEVFQQNNLKLPETRDELRIDN